LGSENEGNIIREPSLSKDVTATRGSSHRRICRSSLTYAQGELLRRSDQKCTGMVWASLEYR